MSRVIGTFNDHMQNGVYRVDKNGIYGRRTSKAGAWTDRITQNIDAQPDVHELAHRVDNESRVDTVDDETGRTTRCKIVGPCTKFPIVQGDPCIAFLGKKDFCPFVLSHCNGLAIDEYPHALAFMLNTYFVGLADKNYAGDMTETSMTLQQRGTFSYCPDNPIDGGLDLVCIPNCNYISTVKGHPLYYVPDLMTWPDEEREVFFKWVPAHDFEKALRYIRGEVRKHLDYITFENELKELLKETRTQKNGKPDPWKKKLSNMGDELKKMVNDLLKKSALNSKDKSTTIGYITDYHRHMALDMLLEHLKDEVKHELFAEYKKARAAPNSLVKWNFNERWDRADNFGSEKMDFKNSFSELIKPMDGSLPWLRDIDDLFFILENAKRYGKQLENTIKRFTKARTQRGCTREGRTQAMMLQQ